MPSGIEEYAVVGDLHTAAMVGRDGSIDWLCLPRFDAPACFAALLHDESAGHWRIGPAGHGRATRRRYRNDTLILETEWDTPEGSVRLVDFMPPRDEAADIVRVVEGISGSVPMQMSLVLRFDYGSVVPWVRHDQGYLAAIAGPDSMWLNTDVALRGQDRTTVATFTVGAGDRVPFVLTHHPSHLPRPRPVDPEIALDQTQRFWQDWIGRCRYRGRWGEAVRRALITLKALTYAPTGGIVAAATTSLPERAGGSRNWDYRFCWLRDATFTLQALLGSGYVTEAKQWREWLLRAAAGDPADLQIMYGLDGTRRLPEYQLGWLSGYQGAKPVRVGNAAVNQFQLDVWGEVLDGLHVSRNAGIAATDAAWDLQCCLLDYLEGNWRDADNGLWEVRGPRRHFVHSKVMAWVGFDRAVSTVDAHGLGGPVDRWRAARAEVHAEVCAKGFDPDRNTFTQFYGSHQLDAALLLIPRVGFLPWHDPRVLGTIDAVRRDLNHHGFLLRYRTDANDVDGLAGPEGAFLACTFWLVDALHGVGRAAEATELFEQLLSLRNDVGLLSEQYDPVARRQLGNTPQAFSLVGLVNSARRLNSDPAHPAATQRRPGATAQTSSRRSVP